MLHIHSILDLGHELVAILHRFRQAIIILAIAIHIQPRTAPKLRAANLSS